MKRRSFALALALTLLAGCQDPPGAVSPGTPASGVFALGGQDAAAPAVKTVPSALAVRVDFPAPRRVLAAEADVVSQATVALMDPSGATIVTGVTDAGGRATLTPDAAFNPAVGDTFVLEAVKGLGGNAVGQDALRLRTVVQWTADGWVSASSATPGDPVVINALTSAVAMVSGLDVLNVPLASVIGKVDALASPAALNAAPVLTGHPDSEIATLASAVTSFVSGDVDPLAAVKQLTPTVTSLSTASALTGEVITVAGAGFSPLPGGNTVTFGGQSATVLLASPTRLVVTVPQLAPGSAAVSVATSLGASATSAFTVATPAVTLSGVPTGYVYPGEAMTLTGAGFNPLAAANQVLFNGTPAVPTTATASSLQVTVPQGAKGPVMVRIPGFSSSPMPLLTGLTQVEAFTTTTRRDALTSASWTTTGQATMIAKPNPGTGAQGVLSPSVNMTLPAGTYHYSSISIPAGVTVTLGGNVTIYCVGNAAIAGVVTGKGASGTPGAAGANLTMSVGGTLSLTGAGSVSVDGGNGALATSNGGPGGALDISAAAYSFSATSKTTAIGGTKGGATATDGAAGTIKVVGYTGTVPGVAPTPTQPAMPYDTTTTQLVQSTGYDLGGATNPTLVYAGYTADADVLPGTAISWKFSDSADGSTWGAWTSTITTLTKRYVRFQATLSTTSGTTTPVIRSINIKYHP